MMSATPLAANGPVLFVVLDIHSLAEQFYFSDQVHLRLKSCVPLLTERLATLEDFESVSIAFPDEGAAKRFRNNLPFGEHIVCVKKRQGEKRFVTIAEGSPAGRHCVLVDDLVQTGGTLIEAARALLLAGARKVSAYVTHAVFPNETWRRFLEADPSFCGVHFSHIFVTNSIPNTADALRGRAPFEVLSITPIIEEIIGLV
jgi:phosphoribosylpyrophosphate synthetase